MAMKTWQCHSGGVSMADGKITVTVNARAAEAQALVHMVNDGATHA